MKSSITSKPIYEQNPEEGCFGSSHWGIWYMGGLLGWTDVSMTDVSGMSGHKVKEILNSSAWRVVSEDLHANTLHNPKLSIVPCLSRNIFSGFLLLGMCRSTSFFLCSSLSMAFTKCVHALTWHPTPRIFPQTMVTPSGRFSSDL